MEMKTPGRRRPLAPRIALGVLVALAALGAGHALLWRAMAAEIEQGFATWVQVRRAQGWRVDHAAPVRAGYPLSAALILPNLRIEGGEATLPGGFVLQAERAVLRVALPRLDRLRVEMPGAQRLRIGDDEYRFAADTLVALVPLEGGTPPRGGEVLAERLRLSTPAGPMAVGSARATLDTSSTATEGEAALEVTATAEEIDLPAAPGGRAAAFGRRIAAFGAEMALSGPVPPGRFPVVRAESWRDAGGTLEVKSLSLRWGPVGATAAATLALDEGLQPMGAGSIRLTGAAEALDALAEAGLVGRRAAATARAILPLMSRPNPAGQPEVEVPLTIEDRTLAVARIPVLRFTPLAWPAPDRER
ncbi:DUF2125 domain-containing protein [Falsiroseomonas stagni]|nr:DUF2125 domain-containing protein [Falsiroseomonas stagni]